MSSAMPRAACLQVGVRADPAEAELRAEGDDPAGGGGLQGADRLFAAVGHDEAGGGVERGLDFRVAAGPGRGGAGIAQSRQSAAESSEQGRREVGLGAGGLETGRERAQRVRAGGTGGSGRGASPGRTTKLKPSSFWRCGRASSAAAGSPSRPAPMLLRPWSRPAGERPVDCRRSGSSSAALGAAVGSRKEASVSLQAASGARRSGGWRAGPAPQRPGVERWLRVKSCGAGAARRMPAGGAGAPQWAATRSERPVTRRQVLRRSGNNRGARRRWRGAEQAEGVAFADAEVLGQDVADGAEIGEVEESQQPGLAILDFFERVRVEHAERHPRRRAQPARRRAGE